MTRVLFALLRMSPWTLLFFAGAIWWFGGALLAGVLGWGVAHRLLLWTILIVALALVALAIAHAGGIVEERWPRNFQPQLRSWVMDILDKYTNRMALEVMVNGRVKAEKFDADSFYAALLESIIGQDDICREMANSLEIRLGKTTRTKPVGKYLFAGPPGTGKTATAKKAAKTLGRGFISLDMTKYADPQADTVLFGVPTGFEGSKKYGKLTGGLRDAPRSVVLFDEIEKAHKSVLLKLLKAMDEGVISDASDDKPILCNQAIFAFTTNAAWERIEQAREGASDPDALKVATTGILVEAGFPAEVVSRLDEVFCFRPVVGMNAARLAILQIGELVGDYDLALVEDGCGIAPSILMTTIERAEALQKAGGVRAVIGVLEKALGKKLITVREAGAKEVRLVMPGGSSALEDIAVEPAS